MTDRHHVASYLRPVFFHLSGRRQQQQSHAAAGPDIAPIVGNDTLPAATVRCIHVNYRSVWTDNASSLNDAAATSSRNCGVLWRACLSDYLFARTHVAGTTYLNLAKISSARYLWPQHGLSLATLRYFVCFRFIDDVTFFTMVRTEACRCRRSDYAVSLHDATASCWT